MKTVKIFLGHAENVKKFVTLVNDFPYELDLRMGRHVVDAKSILGIFSLDLSNPVYLDIHSDSCDDILKALHDFIIK